MALKLLVYLIIAAAKWPLYFTAGVAFILFVLAVLDRIREIKRKEDGGK